MVNRGDCNVNVDAYALPSVNKDTKQAKMNRILAREIGVFGKLSQDSARSANHSRTRHVATDT